MFKGNFKLRGKILTLIITSLLLLGALIFSVVYFQVRSVVVYNLNTSLDSYIKLSYDMINLKYPGDWKVDGGKLYKGNKLINDDTEFVDSVQQATNSPATIFLGDTRISTNVINNGSRAIGTKVSPEVKTEVLEKGKEFTGEVLVVDKKHQAKYVPIKDTSGKNIGIWFIGIEKVKIDNQVNKLMLLIGFIILVIITIAVLISIIFANRIVLNIRKIQASLRKISEGDLSEECIVTSRDETSDISNSINSMRSNIATLVSQITNSSINLLEKSEVLSSTSEEIAASSEEVSSAIHEVSEGSSTQATDLVDITSILNNFSVKLSTVVLELDNINKTSKNIDTLAGKSTDELSSLSKSVDGITNSFNEFVNKISLLGDNMNQITQITGVINNIAAQTNLLALNAAIEAARAGESGRGFAIVADEIRKLAEQSKLSSESINMLINNINIETSAMIQSSASMNAELKNQVNIINSAVYSFEEILSAIGLMLPKIESVSTETIIIDTDKNSIVEKIEMLSSLSEQIAASSEEISASSEQVSTSTVEVSAAAQTVNELTTTTMELVRKFKITKNS